MPTSPDRAIRIIDYSLGKNRFFQQLAELLGDAVMPYQETTEPYCVQRNFIARMLRIDEAVMVPHLKATGRDHDHAGKRTLRSALL